MRYEAIIWDCDGVLIDSEVLACYVIVKSLTDIGYKIPLEDYFRRFLGKSQAQMFHEIELETGLQLEKKFSNDLIFARQKEVFSQHLQETAGVRDVLNTLDIPMAVASGSNFDRLCYTLEITNLIDFFNGHIYSTEMVKKGKPAPDIFFYAAEKLNVSPEKCLVIEDSINGVNAAKAAGMDIYANESNYVRFNGTESYDNARIVSYIWTLNDTFQDLSLTGSTPMHFFEDPGTYGVKGRSRPLTRFFIPRQQDALAACTSQNKTGLYKSRHDHHTKTILQMLMEIGHV